MQGREIKVHVRNKKPHFSQVFLLNQSYGQCPDAHGGQLAVRAQLASAAGAGPAGPPGQGQAEFTSRLRLIHTAHSF